MQGEEWVILLSLLPYEAEDKLKEDIITALKPYALLSPADIHLTSRDDKYSAALRVPSVKGKVIEDLRELRVGESVANIRRYYHDHQLYINRVPRDISPKEVSKYFSNFGTVLNVVLVPSLKVNEKYMHCYIKFEQSKSVDKVLLVRKLELGGREIRALRTFRIGESESTDKRLEIVVEPIPESIEVLENHINQHFQALGDLRERVRLEVTDKRTCRGILAFTSKERAAEILAEFDPKSISKGLYANCKIELKTWSQAVEEGCRVFAARLFRNLEESKVRQVFESYGEISDLTLTPNKTNTCLNAIITYSKMSSAKMLLAEYLFNEDIKRLFSGKPLIEFYLNPSERIHYNNYLNRGKPPQKNFNPVHINPNPNNLPFNQPSQFMPYPPMQGMQGLMPPPFMPRPNYNNPNNYPNPSNNYPNPNYPNQK